MLQKHRVVHQSNCCVGDDPMNRNNQAAWKMAGLCSAQPPVIVASRYERVTVDRWYRMDSCWWYNIAIIHLFTWAYRCISKIASFYNKWHIIRKAVISISETICINCTYNHSFRYFFLAFPQIILFTFGLPYASDFRTTISLQQREWAHLFESSEGLRNLQVMTCSSSWAGNCLPYVEKWFIL